MLEFAGHILDYHWVTIKYIVTSI